jgi:hypothetical protein
LLHPTTASPLAKPCNLIPNSLAHSPTQPITNVALFLSPEYLHFSTIHPSSYLVIDVNVTKHPFIFQSIPTNEVSALTRHKENVKANFNGSSSNNLTQNKNIISSLNPHNIQPL